jgi:hypothetical protein
MRRLLRPGFVSDEPKFLGDPFSSRGHVLLYLATKPDSTIREAAEALELTERRVFDLIHELLNEGLIMRQRYGRRCSYVVDPSARCHVLGLGNTSVQVLVRSIADGLD